MDEQWSGETIVVDGVPVQVTPKPELELRANRLQEHMREARLDGLILTHNADMFYAAGVVQQGQVYVPLEGPPLLMVRKHAGRAAQSVAMDESSVVEIRSLRELPELVLRLTERPQRIGFTFDTLPVSLFESYKKALADLGAALVDASLTVRQARAVKTAYEVEQIRKAAEIADTGLRAACEHLREGVTEQELAAHVEQAMRASGHSGTVRIRAYGQEMHMGHLLSGSSGALPSFMNSPTGGYGAGPWAPYGGGARLIRRGEPIVLDYTGEWGGYLTDQTRMLSLGRLELFWHDAYAATLDILAHLEANIRAGMTSGEFYDMALSRAAKTGYAGNFMGPPEEESPGQRVPFVGHGVGLELDEWPPLQRGTSWVLQEGMVLAVEPKLVYTGRGAVGIEDTYILTGSGLQALTFSSREIAEV